MDESNKKPDENSGGEQSDSSKGSQACSSPKDIPNAEFARNRNFVAVGSPANMFSSILAGMYLYLLLTELH